MKNKLIIATAITIVALAGAGVAQADTQRLPGLVDRPVVLPNFEDQLRQQQAVVEKPRVDDYSGTNVPLPPISTVTFNGPTILDSETLTALTQPYLDRPITDSDIADLKNKIADEYQRRGYPLVKVATPTQDLTDGELTINIFEGRVGEIIPQTNGIIASYIPVAFAKRLEGEVFNEKQAEEVVNDLNEINNINSSITLTPGKKPITTDVIVNIEEQPGEDRNFVAADNYGSKLTGEYVGSLHLEKSNAVGVGEKLSFDGRVSDENLYGAGVGVKLPTGIHNTFIEANYYYSQNEIGDRLAFLESEGKSHISSVAISGNVINEDTSKLTLRTGLDVGQYKSYIFGDLETNDDVRRGFVGATYLGISPETRSVVLVDAKLSRGLNILGASEEGDLLNTRAAADPEAWIFEPSIYARHDFTEDDTVSVYAHGQWATNKLLSSNLFVIGGYGSVRGFEVAQEAGEAGWSVNAEYKHNFQLTDDVSLGVGPWFDIGHVYNRIPDQTLDDSLYSAGLGAEVTADLVPVGPTSVRVDWAHPIGNYTSPEVDDNSFYFHVQQDF